MNSGPAADARALGYYSDRGTMAEAAHIAAHKRSIYHREQVLGSQTCGCFYCLAIFPPDSIREWVDNDTNSVGQTALCPECGIDSVIGSAAGYPITRPFLDEMRQRWFS